MAGPDDESWFVSFGGYSRAEPTAGAPAFPSSGDGQSCALCGEDAVAWVHPLDPAKVGYVAYGKSWTLPSFWTVCADCERVYAAGDDEAVIARMKLSDGWPWATPDDERELLRTPLSTFRAADLGARRLSS